MTAAVVLGAILFAPRVYSSLDVENRLLDLSAHLALVSLCSRSTLADSFI